jgi:hypothetical protein
MLIEPAEQFFAFGRHLETVLSHGLDVSAGDPEQLFQDGNTALRLQLGENIGNLLQWLLVRGVAQPAEQRRLEPAAELFGHIAVLRFREFFRRTIRGWRTHREIRGEQLEFRNGRGVAHRAHLVHQSDVLERYVRLSRLQPRQVIGQRQDAAREGVESPGIGRDLVVDDVIGQRFRFLGEHGGAIELDHEQRAHHLVQMGDAETQARLVGGIFRERFERETRLFQRLVDLGLDPTQRAQVDFAVRAHP